MVDFRIKDNKYGRYVYAYHNNKFLQYLGREDKVTPELKLYVKKKWERILKNEKNKRTA